MRGKATGRDRSKYIIITVILIIPVILAACRVTREVAPVWHSPLPLPIETLGPGDELDVRFVNWPELNVTQKIRGNGFISLPHVKPVKLAGLTTEAAEVMLENLYERILIKPDIMIIVRSIGDQYIYVGGEVARPGIITVKNKMTVVEAIMEAGGVNKRTAKTRNIIVIRMIGDQRYLTSIDLDNKLYDHGSLPFFLMPHDIVYVPQNDIDKLNQWVDQYLNNLLPDWLYATYNVNERTTLGVSP